MTTKEIIETKKAMLDAIAETVDFINGKIEWKTNNLADSKENLEVYTKEYAEEHDGNTENITDTWRYEGYQRDIRECTNSIKAYQTLLKALEKMI